MPMTVAHAANSKIGPPSNYFIKEEYRHRVAEKSHSRVHEEFWTSERRFFSAFAGYCVYKKASQLIKKYNLQSAIDVGCGDGVKLALLIRPLCQTVVGIDTEESIAICTREYPTISFRTVNLNAPDSSIIQNQHFDLVICRDVIEHLTNPNGCLEFIKNASHRDSLILISTPERDILRGTDCISSNKPEHIREWNQIELAAYITAQGFEIQWHKVTPAIRFSPRIKVLKRILQYIREYGTIFIHQTICCKIR